MSQDDRPSTTPDVSPVSHLPYLNFWGADAAVFKRPIDTIQGVDLRTALYEPSYLQTLLSRVVNLCSEGGTFLALEGSAGVGKTTLLKRIAREVSYESHEILVTSLVKQESKPGWLRRVFNRFLGGPLDDELTRDNILDKFADLTKEKRKLIVCVDSSHFARTPEAFEEIESILNLQSHKEPLCSFFMAGSGPWTSRLRGSNLEQHLATRLNMPYLDQTETSEYVDHRMNLAGIQSQFSEEAKHAIHRASKGIYTAINNIAESALVEAFHRQSFNLSGDLVQTVLSGNFLNAPSHQAEPPPFKHETNTDEADSPKTRRTKTVGKPAPQQDPSDDEKPAPAEFRQQDTEDTNPTIKLGSLFKPSEDPNS